MPTNVNCCLCCPSVSGKKAVALTAEGLAEQNRKKEIALAEGLIPEDVDLIDGGDDVTMIDQRPLDDGEDDCGDLGGEGGGDIDQGDTKKGSLKKKNQISSPSRKLRQMGSRVVGQVDHIDADTNQLEWLNKAIQSLWPFVNAGIARLLKDDIAPMLNASLPAPLNTFAVKEFYLGNDAPRVGPVSAYSKNKQDFKGFEIDVFVSWRPTCNVVLAIMGITLGIQSLCIEGTVSIVFRPLLNEVPIVGGMQIFLINPPEIDLDFTGAANIIDFPLIAGTIRGLMNRLICDLLVLPNRIFIPFVDDDVVDMTIMQFPRPEAVVRLHLLKGHNLAAKDISLTGQGSSDPYAVIKVGAREFKSEIIKKTLNPNWDEFIGKDGKSNNIGDFFMFNKRQLVRIAVFDHDIGSSDDLIGNSDTTIGDIALLGKTELELKEGSDNDSEETSGSIEIELQTLRLHPVHDFHRLPVEDPTGKGLHMALVQFQVLAARGIPKKIDRSTVNISMQINEDVKDVRKSPWGFQKLVSPILEDTVPLQMQAMIENLRLETHMPEHQLTHFAQIEPELITEILRKRPSYDCCFNFGCHFLVTRPKDVELTVKMYFSTKSTKREHACGIFRLEELMDRRYMKLVHLKTLPPEEKIYNEMTKTVAGIARMGKSAGTTVARWISSPFSKGNKENDNGSPKKSQQEKEEEERQEKLEKQRLKEEEQRLKKQMGSVAYLNDEPSDKNNDVYRGRRIGNSPQKSAPAALSPGGKKNSRNSQDCPPPSKTPLKRGEDEDITLELRVNCYKLIHISEYEELVNFYKDSEH